MKAIHLVRPGSTKSNGRGRKGTKAVEYPPGYFTGPCRSWWPGWAPMLRYGNEAQREAHGREQGQRLRETKSGFGAGAGTVILPGSAKGLPPGWMGGKERA